MLFSVLKAQQLESNVITIEDKATKQLAINECQAIIEILLYIFVHRHKYTSLIFHFGLSFPYSLILVVYM